MEMAEGARDEDEAAALDYTPDYILNKYGKSPLACIVVSSILRSVESVHCASIRLLRLCLALLRHDDDALGVQRRRYLR